MVMELVSGLSLASDSDSESFLAVDASLSQDGCQREGFWEVVRHVVSPFDLFPNSSGWWRLFSFMFFTRTSCHKTIHANGYYGAWPGWAVSINVLPLTILFTSKFFYYCYTNFLLITFTYLYLFSPFLTFCVLKY